LRSNITLLKTILTLAVVSCVLLVLYRPSVWAGLLFVLVVVLVAVYGKRVSPQRDQSFENDVNRFGVKAKKFSARKVLDEFGTSCFHYQLEGLEVTQGELTGLHFVVESVAGYVTRPKLEAGQFRVTWEDDSDCRTRTLPIDEAVECARKLSGAFRFDKLRPGDPPLSFQWSFMVLNCDAQTEWEYAQLYGEEPDPDPALPHVGGRAEYFARVVWFPIESFCMSVTLPSRLTERPSLSVERLKGDVKIPRDQVVRDSVLQVYPRGDSAWVKDEVRWERDWSTEKTDSALLQHVSEGTSHLEVEKPLVGSRYLLGWPMPGTDRAPEFEFLVGRSQEVRQKSLEHAGRRKRRETATSLEQIKELFRAFDEEIRSQHALSPDREHFTTTLMTYDLARRRLVIVESRINGQEIEPAGWDFSLPFGFGLSGACFKEGTNAFMYVGGQDTNEDDGKYYLPVQGTVSYQILLALPVDHRDFVEPKPENGEPVWERSRQLIGIVSVGSNSSASNLHEFAIEIGKGPKTAPKGGADQPPAKADKLHDLRERCQKLGDDICDLLQPLSGAAQQ
jgi:hypothetical protein